MNKLNGWIFALALSLFSVAVLAAEVTVPNSFSAGMPAVAAEVNANFNAVKSAVDDNDSRIAALEAQIDTLQDYIDDLQAVMTLQNDRQGNPAVVFSGVNVQINDGSGSSASDTVNGLGNLIIGYDENTPVTAPVCSLGTHITQAACEGAGQIWAAVHKSGSHNLVIGPYHNYSQQSGLVAGQNNYVTRRYSSVIGGRLNYARGDLSVIVGGASNITSGIYGTVLGGEMNTASGQYSSVSGGKNNTASGLDSSISGGYSNAAGGTYGSVGGGQGNSASATGSSVNGGLSNIASGLNSSVSGGYDNDAATTNEVAP